MDFTSNDSPTIKYDEEELSEMTYKDQKYNYVLNEARMLKTQSLAGVTNMHSRVFQLLIDKLIDKQFDLSKGKKIL